MNVAGDAEQELSPQVEAIIKTWTGEDGLDYERKYAEGFTANPTAKLMILTNDFPTFTDKSMGTWRRLKIVPFHRDDPMIVEKGLDKTIASEMPGVLNWALEGLKDLEQNGGFVVPEVSKRLMEMHKEESNPARMFLKENYEYDPEYPFGVSRQSLYDGYARWCNAKGYQKLNDRNFGKEIRREFPQVMESRVGGKKSDTRYRIHKGLKVSPGAEVLRLLSQKR
jgi:putative DNA primase/helicase